MDDRSGDQERPTDTDHSDEFQWCDVETRHLLSIYQLEIANAASDARRAEIRSFVNDGPERNEKRPRLLRWRTCTLAFGGIYTGGGDV